MINGMNKMGNGVSRRFRLMAAGTLLATLMSIGIARIIGAADVSRVAEGDPRATAEEKAAALEAKLAAGDRADFMQLAGVDIVRFLGELHAVDADLTGRMLSALHDDAPTTLTVASQRALFWWDRATAAERVTLFDAATMAYDAQLAADRAVDDAKVERVKDVVRGRLEERAAKER